MTAKMVGTRRKPASRMMTTASAAPSSMSSTAGTVVSSRRAPQRHSSRAVVPGCVATTMLLGLALFACAPGVVWGEETTTTTTTAHHNAAEATSAHGHGPQVCPENVSTSAFYKTHFRTKNDLILGTEGYVENVEEKSELNVFALNFKEVELPFLVSLILLIVALLRVAIQGSWLGKVLPDSCMVIVIGVLIGVWIRFVNQSSDPFKFSNHTFFFFVLPPIIFEAGYVQCNNRVFMDNLGSILINAILGTTFNTFALGYAMYGVSTAIGIDMSPIEGLVFGSFIAAVDPVAVLTVFEEMHVHDTLHTIVFGESILNDGVAVVLYRICVALAYENNISQEPLDVGSSFATGIASFIVVFVGGLLMGILHGVLAALVTRFLTSERARVMEPFILLFMGYMSYLMAEIFHFSGIVSIMICGMLMKHYAAKNIHKTSRISIHYFLKLTAGTAETLVFLLLGVEVVTSISEGWNTAFIFSAYFLSLAFRATSVACSSFFLNKIRHLKISFRDQCVIAYGGLRGAIAFALAFVLVDSKYICSADFDPEQDPPDEAAVFSPFPHRDLFVSTTIVIVMLTVFVQGTTIKPILEWLKISRAEEHETLGFERLNLKLVDYTMRVVETITHIHTSNWLRDFYFSFDLFLRRYLVKPGGSYNQLLERAEEKHMEDLLRSYKTQRARDLSEAENRLHEHEIENYRWLKMHDNFRKVLQEIGHMADVSKRSAPEPLRRRYYDDHGHERAPGPCESLVATIKHAKGEASTAPTPEMQRARNRRLRVQFSDADVVDEGEQRQSGHRDWKYKGEFRARDLESALPAASLRRRHRKHRDADTISTASDTSATSQASFESSSTVSGLLSDGELNLVRRFASDSNLAPRSHTQAFMTGETWIPIPPTGSDSSDHEQPRSSSQQNLGTTDSRPLLGEGMDPIEEIEF